MSIIIHRCTTCGHDDLSHHDQKAECSEGWCKCGMTRGAVVSNAPPELCPTFLPADGSEVARVSQPGVMWGGSVAAVSRRLCSCEACVAMFEAATA